MPNWEVGTSIYCVSFCLSLLGSLCVLGFLWVLRWENFDSYGEKTWMATTCTHVSGILRYTITLFCEILFYLNFDFSLYLSQWLPNLGFSSKWFKCGFSFVLYFVVYF